MTASSSGEPPRTATGEAVGLRVSAEADADRAGDRDHADSGEERAGCVVGKLVKVDHPPLPASQRADRRAWRRTLRTLALVAYVPLLLTRPGWLSADTKTYLYLDPGQLLDGARSMWDPTVGMGTVSHQRIGFLWPMGPWYWLAETAGLPDWVAQRLWWGSIMLAAGAGVAYLLRTLGWRPGPGATAAVFGYALSPVILTLMARLSGVLLPFCGLPWLVAFAIQTNRHRGWRYPALFALAAVTFGSVNATGILLVGIAPALWLAYSVIGSREASARQAATAAARIAVLTLATSAWWIAGLNVQRTHGLGITRYSETATTVASTSLSHEVLRGLGYWFFYGRDRLGPWIEPSRGYTRWAPLIAVTYLIPLLGIAGAAVARWRHRSYFVLLVLVGTALAVGAYPWDANPPFPHLIQAFQSTDAGLAMRSLPRAVPLVALGMAVLLGSGLASLASRWPRLKRPATSGAVALAVLALPPLWLGQFVPDNLRRREEVPDHWQDAAAYLDEHDDGTRVLVVPGSDFAAYDWGAAVDPVLPGLMDRPSVQREAVPNGSPASAHLLDAFDLTLQEGTADADALAPMARLLRAGDVVVVGDWEYERNSVPEPHRMWDFVRHAPGFTDPVGFGESDADSPPPAGEDVPAVGVLPLHHDDETTWVTSSDSPTGAIEPSAPLIIDGDPTTAWHTDGDLLEGQWVEVSLPEPVTVTDLPLGIVDDGRHSRPTRLTLSVDGEEVATVDVPRSGSGGDGTVDLDIPEVTGSRFRLELSEVAVLELPGAVYGDPTPPVAFTEIGLPGPKVPELDERFDSGCRSDLLSVDGEPVPVRIRGTMADALASQPLPVTPCDAAARTALGDGESLITTARGDRVGIDIDQLVLRSRVTDEGGLLAATDDRQAGPQIEIADEGATHLRVHVDGAEPGQPFWLVLGQSYNDGWAATPAGRGGQADVATQRPELVDGFANGWLVTPDAESFDVTLEFTPQRSVDRALWLSLLAGLACVVLALRPARPLATERGPAGQQQPDLEPAPFSPGPALRFPGLRPTQPAAAVTTAAMTTLAWLLAGPAVAAVVGLATAVGSRVRPARGAILAASAGALALAAAYVLYIQLLHHPGPGLDWPYEMRRAHPLGWLAVLLLSTDVALTRLWHRTKPYL